MVIHPSDNVEVRDDGHKYARRDIAEGENVIKYGMPIGHATRAIAKGEHVHVDNVKTNLGEVLEYRYEPSFADVPRVPAPTIRAYRRPDGRIGIRNDLWVIPLVGCVNRLAERLAARVGGLALTHPYGCSQMGEDHERTANMLAQFCHHPNAGGVLVVALGCENNTLESFAARLGYDPKTFDAASGSFQTPQPPNSQTPKRPNPQTPKHPNIQTPSNIRFLRAQDPGDEFEKGLALLAELDAARPKTREAVSASELVVGLKCGGSDGFSGLTANPLVGRFSDWLAARGGSTILTEVPEMFGAETLLMKRCRTRDVFDKCVKMINDFKGYYAAHNQVCYENPSPGNKAGGITTLEDKSLGCVQKGGSAPVEDVLGYGETVKRHGLSLLTGPGNDLVASTVLAAAGCHLVLFTTGRGTPFGCVVPTLKVATNDALAAKKPNWIDWNAMSNPDVEAFAQKVLAVASGEKAKNEVCGAQGIAIFKDGVTL